MTGRGRGDHLPLVRHQLQALRSEPRRRCRQRHASRGSPPARSKELSSGPSSSQLASLRGREVRCGTAEKSGARNGFASCRETTDCGTTCRSGPAGTVAVSTGAISRRRLDAEVPQHLPLERPGHVGDVGILAEQCHQPSVPDSGRRQDGRDAVQAPELLSPMTVASGRRPDAGTLIPQQQGDGLELRAHGRRHAAALGSRLDLTGRVGRAPTRHRRGGGRVADSAGRYGERWSGAGLVKPKTSPLGCRGTVGRGSMPQSLARDEERPGQRA